MAGDQGFEPRLLASKATVLPLDESPVAEGEGIEPPSLLQPTVFKTASSTNRTPSVWQWELESNQRLLGQSQVSYRWTTPLCFRGLKSNRRRPALQATALPLSYPGMVEVVGFEPPDSVGSPVRNRVP